MELEREVEVADRKGSVRWREESKFLDLRRRKEGSGMEEAD